MTNEKLCQNRLKKTKRIGRLLMRLPSIRCVILNGSLASGNHKETSDIDILIIAKDGRIFTARFFVVVLAIILGVKRPKDNAEISDNLCERSVNAGRFCFNYFLTESFLKIPTGRGKKIDHYCADNYSKSKFIAGDRSLFERFMLRNAKLFNRYNCHLEQQYNRHPELTPLRHPELVSGSHRNLRRSRNKFGMTVSRPGNWFERAVKNYQIKKIESDPRTKKYPDLIVYNDKELRFHPPKK